MSTIITDAVRGEITAFCRAFAERYMMQPPEFTDPRYLGGFGDLYARPVGGRTNPCDTAWFAELQARATAADLDALVAAFDTTNSYATCMQRFVLRQLLRATYERDQAGVEVAPALPAWYRAAGWGMPADWNCERPAPAPEPAGTPPGSPRAGPMWRTGSCGESGPFIGLSLPYSIALVKRLRDTQSVGHGAADPDGSANAFALRDAVCAEPEPNVLRDFTVQEIVDGMAGSYSWSRERTMGWLARGAPEDERTMPPRAGDV